MTSYPLLKSISGRFTILTAAMICLLPGSATANFQVSEMRAAQLAAELNEWARIGGAATTCPAREEALPPVVPEASCDHLTTAADHKALMKILLPVMLNSIATGSPHFGPAGAGVFANSFDWHSSVHAHWAALSMARIQGNTRVSGEILKRLSKTALSAEGTYLQNNPGFELPYGQSWFLLLLDELKKNEPARSKEIDKLKDEVTDRILQWLDFQVKLTDRFNICSGSYDSPLMSFMLLKFSRPSQAFNSVVSDIESALTSKNCTDAAKPLSDFVEPGAINQVISESSGPTSSAAIGKIPQGPFQFTNCHELGASASRAWPLASASGRGDQEACRTFHAFLSEFTADKSRWQSDFSTVSHWIPQFLWFGVWNELGRK